MLYNQINTNAFCINENEMKNLYEASKTSARKFKRHIAQLIKNHSGKWEKQAKLTSELLLLMGMFHADGNNEYERICRFYYIENDNNAMDNLPKDEANEYSRAIYGKDRKDVLGIN